MELVDKVRIGIRAKVLFSCHDGNGGGLVSQMLAVGFCPCWKKGGIGHVRKRRYSYISEPGYMYERRGELRVGFGEAGDWLAEEKAL